MKHSKDTSLIKVTLSFQSLLFSDSDMSGPPLPQGWSRQVSRSTGKVYFFNSINGASTYDPADIFKLSFPPPPVQKPVALPQSTHDPADIFKLSLPLLPVQKPMALPQMFYPMSSIDNLSSQNNNTVELGMNHSVTELQMLLAEKKRQLDQKMRELEGGGEEASSEESGFGSLGGDEEQEEFPSVIGTRVKRRVDLWHKHALEMESRVKRLKGDDAGHNSVLNDVHVEMSSTVDNESKVLKQEAEEEEVNQTKKIDEENVESQGSKDSDDSDEEDIYGADEEELEQIAKFKEKYLKEPRKDQNNCLTEQNGHQIDSDHNEDEEEDKDPPEDETDVLLLNADVSFGEDVDEAETVSKERAKRNDEIQINNDAHTVPSTKEFDQDMNSGPLTDDFVSAYHRLLAEQAKANEILQFASFSNISPDKHGDGSFTKGPDPYESVQLPFTEAVSMPGDPKFSSDEESEENSSGPDEWKGEDHHHQIFFIVELKFTPS